MNTDTINTRAYEKYQALWKNRNMNILGISGSVRSGSYNLALLKSMKALCPDDVFLTIYDQIKLIPIFDPELDDDEIPESVCSLISMMRKSDGLIVSTPEYAHGVPGALKNTLDWLVSSDALILKPVVVTSVSTSGLGGIRSHSPLILILSAMNTNVIVEGSMNVPYAQSKFNDDLKLTDELTRRSIGISFMAIKQAVEK
ncbi:MAG: NAD(P)H-dependent oxidoreductase [Gammaproteobacteria bacterium]|nr:NAD(P)H-dependent oxidoreductase [Gammaproteobacteria bacterium]